MAKGNIDLDRSLDDIIKRSKTHPTKPGKSSISRGAGHDSRRGGLGRNSDVNNRVSKPVIRNPNGRGGSAAAINRRIGGVSINIPPKHINSRLSRGGIVKRSGPPLKRGGAVGRGNSSGVSGPFVTDEDRQHSDRSRHGSIDPKTLVITKNISPRVSKLKKTPSGESLVIQSNVHQRQQQVAQSQQSRQEQQQQQNYQHNQQQAQGSYSGYQDQQQPYNNSRNNNSSYQQAPQQSNQKSIVLICNLDPRATAEDVGEACSIFGPILSCDILLDPMGRPLNEAEIEFLYPNSAQECVSKLDNSMADGRLLRVKLQSSATLPVVPRYSSRTVIASARVAQGGFDNNPPQQPMMHQSYNHSQNRSHYNNPSQYSQHRQPQHYQRRF